MFGGDVHLRTFADLQRSGIAPFLGRIGMDEFARPLADIEIELTAIGARTEASANRACDAFLSYTGHRPAPCYGDTPWRDMFGDPSAIDVLAVATPDHLHAIPTLEALAQGCHVIVEKPLCLDYGEAQEIIESAQRAGRIVAVDMHKRYDPDHMRIRNDLLQRIGEPLYGTAYLEEPLEVSTTTFKWASQSDPFTYVGPHWVDLFYHYFGVEPIGLTAVGQKRRLVDQGIDTFDAVQVRVDWANGMSVTFQNNWITPADFEGPVNQGHEIVGTRGKIECDQQYRGLRFWCEGQGSRTANNHFTRDVRRPDGPPVYVGYGADSIIAGVLAICRSKFLNSNLDDLEDHYPSALQSAVTVKVIHAARLVRDLNWSHVSAGRAPAASASFDAIGFEILDPYNTL